MAQHCTDEQLNILNNNLDNNHNYQPNNDQNNFLNDNIVENENVDNNLRLVSIPMIPYIDGNVLEIIKQQANIPVWWNRAQVSNWLGIHNNLYWVSNGFIMLSVLPAHNDENNFIEITFTLNDLCNVGRRQLLNYAIIHEINNHIEYINRIPINIANLNHIYMRVPVYVNDAAA